MKTKKNGFVDLKTLLALCRALDFSSDFTCCTLLAIVNFISPFSVENPLLCLKSCGYRSKLQTSLSFITRICSHHLMWPRTLQFWFLFHARRDVIYDLYRFIIFRFFNLHLLLMNFLIVISIWIVNFSTTNFLQAWLHHPGVYYQEQTNSSTAEVKGAAYGVDRSSSY